jgi:hypothetical protein
MSRDLLNQTTDGQRYLLGFLQDVYSFSKLEIEFTKAYLCMIDKANNL